MRFNDQGYLDAYAESRRYPRIHDAIWNAAVAELSSLTVLDLCCSTGLLGARLRDNLRCQMVWAEQDADAIARGIGAGAIERGRLWTGTITPETIGSLTGFLIEHGVTGVVARRCLCVISEKCPLYLVRDAFDTAGITEVLLEGQAQDVRAVHPFGSADAQVAALAPNYVLRPTRYGRDVRYLRRAA